VQGLLEIGLDLGVVRGEDAMAGIGGLAVDGATTVRVAPPGGRTRVLRLWHCRSEAREWVVSGV
jgi:hypothetical protein